MKHKNIAYTRVTRSEAFITRGAKNVNRVETLNPKPSTKPSSKPYSKQAHNMAQQIVEHGLKDADEIWGIEVPLYVSGLYAGTTDA